MKDYTKEYERMAEESKNLKESATEVMKDFYQLHGNALKSGEISTKNKEFIALGISIAIRCEDCIMSHVRSCYSHGATYEEIAEVVEVAILMGGGPATAYGSHALMCAKSLKE